PKMNRKKTQGIAAVSNFSTSFSTDEKDPPKQNRPAGRFSIGNLKSKIWNLKSLVDPVNLHTDQFVDAQVLHSPRTHVGDVFRGDIMDPHRNQFVRIRMRETQSLQLLNELGRNAMNPEGNQLLQIDVIISPLFQLLHPFRSRAMNAHRHQRVFVRRISSLAQTAHHLRGYTVDLECDQLVRVRDFESLRAKRVDELLIHTEDAKRDQLVGIQIAEVLTLHLTRKGETHIMHRHRVLLLIIDGKAERLHFSRVIGIRLEVKHARAFAVLQIPLAIDLPCVAADGEVNVLASGLREVDAGKR